MTDINFSATVNNSYSQALYELCVEDNVINEVESDNLLAIRTTGAYSSVMRSNYNARKDAIEVMVYNGKDFQIKKNETIKDYILKEEIIGFD